MKLSVIIPTYNEEKTLCEIIEKVLKVPLTKEIIIVDDGSTDSTQKILEKYAGRKAFRILRHEKNRGKGMAVRTALRHVRGDITIIQDADLEYDPGDYPRLVESIMQGDAPVVYGARPLVTSGPWRSYRRYYLGGKLLSFLTNVLFDQKLSDEPTCYKVFLTTLLKSIPLRCRGFEFDPEITARVARRGIKIKEIPIHYYPRSFSEGKKIRWVDGLKAVLVLFRYRFIK